MNPIQFAAVRRVAEARRQHAAAKALVDGPLKALKESLAPQIAAADALAAAVFEAEAELRAVAQAAYEGTGNKKPFPGVAIQLRAKLEYDAVQALAWAQQTRMALSPEALDVKAFEKIASAADLPFVTKHTVPVATIATDLDAVLPSEPEPELVPAPVVVQADNDEDWLHD
jgi:hypothetical protein